MKTKPHTVRFEEEDFKFICKRENLQTAQGIINFLMAEYLKLYRVEKKSIYDNTIEDIKNPKGFTDRVALNHMPIEYVPRETYFEIHKTKSLNRSAEQWQAMKRECGSLEEWNEIKQQIMDADNLTSKQKQIIINTP